MSSVDLGPNTGTGPVKTAPPSGPAGGDLTGNYPDPTVATVGGASASAINTGQALANAATNVNTPSTIVKRDGSGNFAASSLTISAIDQVASGTLSIGGTNASVINIGNSSAFVNIIGSVSTETVSNLNVTNKTITLNSGGPAGSGAGVGLVVEENALLTGYAKTSLDRNSWQLLAPNTAGVVTLTPGAGGITLNQSSHDPVTLAGAAYLSLSNQIITAGSVSLTLDVTGALPLSQTSGSISLTSQVSGTLPGSQVGVIDIVTQTSGSVSLTNKVSGVLPAANSQPLSSLTGSVSLTSQVSGNLPLSQTSGSISLTTQVSGVLPAAQVGVIDVTSGTSGSVSLTNKVSDNLPLSQTSGSISLTNQVSGTLPAAQVGIIDVTTGTSGSVSLANKVSGALPLSQTTGSISLTAQVSGTLPASRVGIIDVTTGTSGSVSLTDKVSGILPAAQVGVIDVTSGTSGSVSLANKVSGSLPLSQTSGSISLVNRVSGTLSTAQGGTGTSAFTQGSIVFVDGAGVYAQNNSSLFWDNTNTRLGLGTGSPASGVILDLSGTGSTLSSLLLPRDSTANRPTGINGMQRFNTTENAMEFFSNSTWGYGTKFIASVSVGSSSANIGSTIVYTVVNDSFVRAYGWTNTTRAATSSSTVPAMGVAYQDALTNTPVIFGFVPSNSANLLGSPSSNGVMFYPKVGTGVYYFTTGYASSGATSMRYALEMKFEEMPVPWGT